MKNIIYFLFLFCTTVSVAQNQHTIKGTVSSAANKKIVLKGYTLAGDTSLSQTVTDVNGNFVLTYPHQYVGAGVLEIQGDKSILLILNNENFVVRREKKAETFDIIFENSIENQTLYEGLKIYDDTENKKVGLAYLLPLYQKTETKVFDFLSAEFEKQNQRRVQFMASLPASLYVSYFLKLRNLVFDISFTPSRFPSRIGENESEFNAFNFLDNRIISSGLYKQLFERYFTLLESYGPQKQYAHINNSIDAVIRNVKSNPVRLSEVSETLFNILEKKNLYPAAEYLALLMLNDNDCHLDDNHKSLFEQYRKMAIGKYAPDIVFATAINGKKKLSDIKNRFRLIVFGASWCPRCASELPQLKKNYDDWKLKKDLEIIFVSLDTDNIAYSRFAKNIPGIATCDFKQWESTPVKDYCVASTPMFYLIDTTGKILLKPNSIEEINYWLLDNQ